MSVSFMSLSRPTQPHPPSRPSVNPARFGSNVTSFTFAKAALTEIMRHADWSSLGVAFLEVRPHPRDENALEVVFRNQGGIRYHDQHNGIIHCLENCPGMVHNSKTNEKKFMDTPVYYTIYPGMGYR